MLEAILSGGLKKLITFAVDQTLGLWKNRKHTRDVIELHKRRLFSAAVTTVLWRELYTFRQTFLEHGLAERNASNRRFFDRWLSDPVVALGWTPGNGWTAAKVAALHADLAKVHV